MAETAHLRPVVIDRHWTAIQGGFRKARHDHTVVTDLAWTHHVKEPTDRNAQSILLVVSQRQKLTNGF
jgi:hypothetical protein